MRHFQDSPVSDAELDDLDMDFVKEYIAKIDFRKLIFREPEFASFGTKE